MENSAAAVILFIVGWLFVLLASTRARRRTRWPERASALSEAPETRRVALCLAAAEEATAGETKGRAVPFFVIFFLRNPGSLD